MTTHSAMGLLQPVYNIPQNILFLLFLLYILTFSISSFYIIWMLRHSVRFRKKKPQKGAAFPILKFIFGSLDIYRIFRKSSRYDVSLTIKCKDRHGDEEFHGKVLNISSDGCMTNINNLKHLREQMILSIAFPINGGEHVVELPAEHIWVSEKDGEFYQGFRVAEFDGDQGQVIFKFLVRFKRKQHE